jgi:acyl carrier protein
MSWPQREAMMSGEAPGSEIVLEALKELNAQRGADEQISDKSDAPLFGAGAKLDSLGLVTLLLEIEDRVRQRHGVAITLADERAMSEKRSPFRTIAALSHYVEKRLAEIHRG